MYLEYWKLRSQS